MGTMNETPIPERLVEAALLTIEDFGWDFMVYGIEHAAELADLSDARDRFITEFGDRERDIINDLCEKFGIEEE